MASIEAVMAALDVCDKMPAWFKELSPQARKDRAKVYEMGLRELSDAELQKAVELAVGACKWFPVPVELKELVRPKVASKAALARSAEAAYDYVLSSYMAGAHQNVNALRTALGEPAAHAFLAAGGSSIFEWCEPGQDQAFRQKRFIEAYLLHAEAEEQQKLLGGDKREEIGAGEARGILKQMGDGK